MNRLRLALGLLSVGLTILFFVVFAIDQDAAQSIGSGAALLVVTLVVLMDMLPAAGRDAGVPPGKPPGAPSGPHPLRRRTDKVVAGAMIWGTVLTLLAAFAIFRQGDIVDSAKHSANDAKAAAATAKETSDSIQEGRATTFGTICQQIRVNTVGGNNLTDALDALILGGVKQSRSFDEVYKKFGLPPYKERLARAKKQTKKLDATKVAPVNCAELRKQGNITPNGQTP